MKHHPWGESGQGTFSKVAHASGKFVEHIVLKLLCCARAAIVCLCRCACMAAVLALTALAGSAAGRPDNMLYVVVCLEVAQCLCVLYCL